MKQAIAGVTPSQSAEVTVATVWPSICAYSWGRWLGRLCAIEWPNLYIFRLGNLLALAFIPLALVLYFYRLMPQFGKLGWHGAWYKLTNRGVVILHDELIPQMVRVAGIPLPGWRFRHAVPTGGIGLDGFDQIELQTLAGQAWFQAADLVFLSNGQEVARLPGVAHPQGFQRTCLKSRQSFVGVSTAQSSRPAVA